MDGSLYRAVNRLADHTGWAHPLVIAYAKYGVVLFAALLLAAWWAARRDGDLRAVAASVWTGAGTLIALGVVQVLGNAVGRARPYAAMTHVHVLVDRTTDFSFPSDHATAVGAVAAGLWLFNRRLGLAGTACAALMAFARVYVGAHYPGDVAAGVVVGAGTVVALYPFAIRAIRPTLGLVQRSPLRPLVVAKPA